MRNVYGFFLLVALSVVLAGCSEQSSSDQEATAVVQSVEQQAWVAIRDGALLVDVRSQSEYDSGHIEGAINIPHDRIKESAAEFGDDPERSIVLYCRSGHRAGIATKSLQSLGFNRIINAGGYKGLSRAQ